MEIREDLSSVSLDCSFFSHLWFYYSLQQAIVGIQSTVYIVYRELTFYHLLVLIKLTFNLKHSKHCFLNFNWTFFQIQEKPDKKSSRVTVERHLLQGKG